MKINEKLRELRKNSSYNQEELAKYLGIDQSLISKIENGERSVTLDMICKLSELYVCSLESLLDENKMPDVIKIPFRSKNATADDFCQISKANKLILNLREMISIKEK